MTMKTKRGLAVGGGTVAESNFTCVDPNDKVTKPLNSAACFTGIYKYLIYKK